MSSLPPASQSPAVVSGLKYSEWQRNSGLRVLEKVLDRQKLLEATDGFGGQTQVGNRQLET